jgi:glyoxylase-like metal-dependent hydrolase (beta-lactamase superfamily II)
MQQCPPMASDASMSLGDLQLISVSDGTCKIPPEYFMGSDWSAHQELLGPDGMFTGQLGCFVVRSSQRTVLVDTGVGPLDNQFFHGGHLPAALERAGVARDEIDTVVCTHLHLDHAGWLVQDGEPFFPNANVRFGEGDWGQFVTGGDGVGWIRNGLRLLDQRGRVEPITTDSESIAPGITARAAPGHTHGHIVLVLSSQGERLVLLGDAVTCPAQLEEPDWQAISDVDPGLATRTREALFRELEGSGDLAVAAHFPDLRFGRVLPGGGARRFVVP